MSDQYDNSAPIVQAQRQSSWPSSPSAPPDPGSPQRAKVAGIACILLVAIVAISQQFSAHQAAQPRPDVRSGTSIATLYTKIMVKIFGTVGANATQTERTQLKNAFAPALRDMSHTADERIAAVAALGELGDKQDAIEQLDSFTDWLILNADLAAKNPLGPNKELPKAKLPDRIVMIDYVAAGPDRAEYELDAAALRAVYADVATPEQQARLKDRHGYFGRLALTHNDRKSAEHAALMEGGTGLVALLFIAGMIFLFAFLAGFVCFIIALVQLLSKRLQPRMPIPDAGGSVYLELVAVFVGGFLLVKLALMLVAMLVMRGQPEGTEPPSWLTTLAMGIQWLLILVPFYPLLVGVPASRWRADLGLHAPRGVFREIAFGVFAYLAGLPLLLLGAAISLILKLITDSLRGTSGAPPSNPVLDEVMNANPGTLILFFCLATIWAPFVEECVFRGALFRHLRSWLIFPVAAIGSALVFGLMHGYELIMLGPVITLGFTFAIMRHYRGSLVGPIIAHALHNGTVMLLLISFITLAKD